jgi:hypothetical protein
MQYTNICIYIYIHDYVYMYKYMQYTNICMYIYIWQRIHIYIQVCISTLSHSLSSAHMSMSNFHIHVYIHILVYAYIYTYSYACIYIYTHFCLHLCRFVSRRCRTALAVPSSFNPQLIETSSKLLIYTHLHVDVYTH